MKTVIINKKHYQNLQESCIAVNLFNPVHLDFETVSQSNFMTSVGADCRGTDIIRISDIKVFVLYTKYDGNSILKPICDTSPKLVFKPEKC